MDHSLREMGVSDLALARKIRVLAENFYGRVGAYEKALESDASENDLPRALGRNVYENEEADASRILSKYVLESVEAFANHPLEALARGEAPFIDPEKLLP